jgi:hypothetical protein
MVIGCYKSAGLQYMKQYRLYFLYIEIYETISFFVFKILNIYKNLETMWYVV